MKRYLWSMAGEYYPELYVPEGDAGPLEVRRGERVRIRFTNSTMMYHPMHLHGHFYRVLAKPGEWDQPDAPLKDTVAVGPGQRIDIEFTADNPGHWFFHCHNLYHLASGMARQVRYVV
ncbi:MAG: multicopper oxidase domain-containing protein, partial [Planctomycetota bacterium]|nr:multicopper oxidase domain-containing protein [Planctomycetota bacterium]